MRVPFALGLSTGCARYYSSKAGETVDQFDRDNTDRTKERTGQYGTLSEQVDSSCLIARGWVRSKQWEPPPAGFSRGCESSNHQAATATGTPRGSGLATFAPIRP